MGRRAVDKTKKIESKIQRNVAFCKRRRGILKKAIEISRMCEQQVFLVIFDPLKNKALQFCSEHQFGFSEAYNADKSIRKSDAPENIEFYTNEDYDKLEQIDFRTLRRHNKPTYDADKQIEDGSEIKFEDENLGDNDTTSFGH